MGKFTPIAVAEKTAAQMLDMTPAAFRDLVAKDALPGPVRIHDNIERWIVSDLENVLNGDAMNSEEIKW